MTKIKINATDAQIKKLLRGQTVQLKHSQLGNGVCIDLHPENFKKIQNSMKKSTGARIALSEHEISGNGIFGRKADKWLARKGIKKAVYATGAAFKPLAHELIKSAGEMADTYVPGLGTMGANLASSYIDHPEKYQEMYKNRNDGPGIDQGALGTALGTKAAEMLTAKMAERAAKQNGGKLRGCGINPYMPASLSGGSIHYPTRYKKNKQGSGPSAGVSRPGRPPIRLQDDQSNFISSNSNAFYPLLPKSVAAFQRGGSFKL